MSSPILIFDFDGTIADTHQYIIDIYNRLSCEFNYKSISPDEVPFLKHKTSQEIIRYLKIPVMKIPVIISRGKKEFHTNITSLKPFEGIITVLKELKKLNVKMGILSSNALGNITTFLHNHGITLFDFIQATSKLWSKNTTLQSLMKDHGFSLHEIIYIGDEIRDITAAQALGIKVAAVSWGYNSARSLKSHQPDFFLQSPADLLTLNHHGNIPLTS